MAWEPWTLSERSPQRALEEAFADGGWEPPSREVFVFSDIQGDPGALIRSLVMSGAVEKTGPLDEDLELTARGTAGVLVFCGDLLGRGPSNVRVLRILGTLRTAGAQLRVITGNEELRVMLVAWAVESGNPRHAHLPVRGGRQLMTWIREAVEDGGLRLGPDMSSDEARKLLMLDEDWFDGAPRWLGDVVPESQIYKELARIREKQAELQVALTDAGISIERAAAGVLALRDACRAGEFAWYFDGLRLLDAEGGTLMVHAGLNDVVAARIEVEGVFGVNDAFRQGLLQAPLGIYHGSLGNCVRTRYRVADEPFTAAGCEALQRTGTRLLLHGHRADDDPSDGGGQPLTLESGMLRVNVDTGSNALRRAASGLSGSGASVVILRPDGWVCGLAADVEHARALDLSPFVTG